MPTCALSRLHDSRLNLLTTANPTAHKNGHVVASLEIRLIGGGQEFDLRRQYYYPCLFEELPRSAGFECFPEFKMTSR